MLSSFTFPNCHFRKSPYLIADEIVNHTHTQWNFWLLELHRKEHQKLHFFSSLRFKILAINFALLSRSFSFFNLKFSSYMLFIFFNFQFFNWVFIFFTYLFKKLIIVFSFKIKCFKWSKPICVHTWKVL